MAVTKRDIQLVIKARDEATRVVDKYAGSIEKLIQNQDKAGSSASGLSGDIVGLVAALADVERANGLVSVAADRADRAFQRQSNGLAQTRADLAATKAQIQAVQQALANGPQRLVDTMLGGGNVDAVRAQLAGATAELTRLTSAEDRLAASLRTQETALGQQRSSLQQINSIANTTERALASLGNEAERAALSTAAALEVENQAYRGQARAAREAADAKRANDKFSSFMGVSSDPSGGRASISAAVFQDQARMADAAERLLQRTQPLYAIQVKLDQEMAHAATLYKKGAITAGQYEVALEALKLEAAAATEHFERIGRGDRTPSLFGMKPYEIQNMGYQINDVVTQLASGTPALQVMAQQGGQILQLLPNIGTALIATFTNPLLMGGVAVLGSLALVLARASSEAERMRNIEGMLARIGDGASFSAVQLEKNAKALEKIGFSSDQALAQVENFVTQGLNPDYLIAFSKAAVDLADITGKEVPEAAAVMKDAFTSNYEEIAKLDDQMQFLTVAEREQIQAMFESGRASEAREMAFKLYTESVNQGKKAMGEAKGVTESLTGAINDFLSALANTDVIQGFTNSVRNEFQDLARDIRLMSDQATLDDVESRIKHLERLKKEQESSWNLPLFKTVNTALWDSELKDLRAKQAELNAALSKAQGDTISANSAAVQKRRNEREKEIETEKSYALATSDAEKARIDGEKAYKAEMAKSGDEYLANAAKKAAVDVANHQARMRQLEKEKAAQKGTIEFDSPLRGNPKVTSGYGTRKHPITGKRSAHPGVDYAVPVGTPAYAPASGTVEKVEIKGKNGLYIKMNHGSGTESYFLHMSQAKVKEGDYLNKGDLVGLTGGNPKNADGSKNAKAGSSTGPHLHYALKSGGEFVNPLTNTRLKADPGKALAESIEMEEKRAEAQDKFNTKIDEENTKRQRGIDFAKQEMQLEGDALFAAQKTKAVNDAVVAAMLDASRQGLDFDQKRREEIERTVAAEWDLANAKERSTRAVDDTSGERSALLARLETAKELGDTTQIAVLEVQIKDIDDALKAAITTAITFWSQFDTAEARTAIDGLRSLENSLEIDSRNRGRAEAEQPVEQIQARRTALQEQIQFYQEMGQSNVVGALRDQLVALDSEFLTAIDTAIAYWQTHTGPEAEAAILNLENLRNQVVASQRQFTISASQIEDAFSGSLIDSVKVFASTLAETGNPIKALGASFANFASSFIQKIADMILQVVALQVAMSFMNAIGFGSLLGGFGSAAASAGGAAASSGFAPVFGGAFAGIAHTGGIAGSLTTTRPVSPAWFTNATRYHGGGIAGLAPDEVATVLQRGEEILTTSDPRHRFNGGGQAPAPNVDVKIVNAIDSASVVEEGLNTRSGQKAVLNFMRANSRAIQSAMGS